MPYVDGFVIPIPKKNLTKYKALAKLACKVWMEHGALAFCECAGDDLNTPMGMPFTKLAKTKPGETVMFSWILYADKASRNRVNKLAMADPRIVAACKPGKMPFKVDRMAVGGFKAVVSAGFGA